MITGYSKLTSWCFHLGICDEQDSVVRVHESMQDLEGRVSRLEQIVSDMAHGLGDTEGRSLIGELQAIQGGHALGSYLSEDVYPSGKVSEDTAVPPSL